MPTRFEILERGARTLFHQICFALAQSGDSRVPLEIRDLIDRLEPPAEGNEYDAKAFEAARGMVANVFNAVNDERWDAAYLGAIFSANMFVGESALRQFMKLPGCLELDGWWNILNGGDNSNNRLGVQMAQIAAARDLGVTLKPRPAAAPVAAPAPVPPAPRPVAAAAPTPAPPTPPAPPPAPKPPKAPPAAKPAADGGSNGDGDSAPTGRKPITRKAALSTDEGALRKVIFATMCGMKDRKVRWDYRAPAAGLRALAPYTGMTLSRLTAIYEGAVATEDELQALAKNGFGGLKLELLSQPFPLSMR